MNIKHVAAIAAVALCSLCGVTSTLAEGVQNATPGRIVLDVYPKGFIPKPLPGESYRPTALFVQAGEFVYCTKTTNIMPIARNVGVFVADTDKQKLCFPIEAYPLSAILIDINDF